VLTHTCVYIHARARACTHTHIYMNQHRLIVYIQIFIIKKSHRSFNADLGYLQYIKKD